MSAIEISKERDFSEVSDDLWSSIQEAPSFKSRFNESNIFDQMYDETVRQYYADATDVNAAGRQILRLFKKWRPMASQFTRHVLRGNVDDPLDATLNWDAEGAGQAIVRPLGTWSFANAAYTQTPTATGRYNLVPDDTQADDSTETATANEQGWLIFGYADFYGGNVVPYDYIQGQVNDDIGVRRPLYTRNAMEGKQTLKVIDRSRGPLIVEPGFDLDIDVNVATANIEMGLWPLGIEVIRADAAEFGGIQD